MSARCLENYALVGSSQQPVSTRFAIQNRNESVRANLESPASNYHGSLQSAIAFALQRKRPFGVVVNDCSIETLDGVKAADAAWASDEFIAQHGFATPYPQAPEICVEIISPSNAQAAIALKVELYLARGAQEVWLVNPQKQIRFYSYGGELKKSKLIPRFKF